MRVAVDPEVCQGHARCWDICPEVFAVDDDGFALVRTPEIGPELEAKAREAASNCPERAITLS
jgi:ferredoxin